MEIVQQVYLNTSCKKFYNKICPHVSSYYYNDRVFSNKHCTPEKYQHAKQNIQY